MWPRQYLRFTRVNRLNHVYVAKPTSETIHALFWYHDHQYACQSSVEEPFTSASMISSNHQQERDQPLHLQFDTLARISEAHFDALSYPQSHRRFHRPTKASRSSNACGFWGIFRQITWIFCTSFCQFNNGINRS